MGRVAPALQINDLSVRGKRVDQLAAGAHCRGPTHQSLSVVPLHHPRGDSTKTYTSRGIRIFWRRDSTPGNTSCGQSTESEGRRRHSSFMRIAEASSCPAYHFQEIL